LEILTNDFSTQERESFMNQPFKPKVATRDTIPINYKLNPDYRSIFVFTTNHSRADIVADGHTPDSIEIIFIGDGKETKHDKSRLMDWITETMYRIEAEACVPF
jgi:hypothetical protein